MQLKRSTHSKFKNTAILFELLTRQVAADTMCGVDNSPALNLIKKYFKSSGTLARELTLYQTLVNERFNRPEKAHSLINLVVGLRSKLPRKDLQEQKYQLISEIKRHYDLKDFFKTTIRDYKIHASIYHVFNNASISNAAEVVRSRYTIAEHLTGTRDKIEEANVVDELYNQQDEEIRLLAYKLMIDKFNDKYSSLSTKQKGVLKEYINNISNTVSLKNFLLKEAASVKVLVDKRTAKVTDPVVKIKLQEVGKLLTDYNKIRTVKEHHVLSLLLYYELLKELKDVESK